LDFLSVVEQRFPSDSCPHASDNPEASVSRRLVISASDPTVALTAGMFASSSDDEPSFVATMMEDLHVGQGEQSLSVKNVVGLFTDDGPDVTQSIPDAGPPPSSPPLTPSIRDVVGLFSDNSNEEDTPSAGHNITLRAASISPPVRLDQVGHLFADSSEEEDEDAEGEDDLDDDGGHNISRNTSSAAGPYTAMTFQNVPDEWLDGI
jgi:hypothetical protein